jgi:hypothetical protein
MALPQTISGATLSAIYNARPFRASNDNHYVIALNGSTELEMYKADNGDNTWATVDASNNPAETAISSLAAVLDGTIIHIVTANNAANTDYLYHTFNTATDVWVVKDETIVSAVDTDYALPSADLGVRSDGSVVCVYQGTSEKIMGTDYARVKYIIRSSGGTWGSPVAVDDAGSISYVAPRNVLGASDKVHISYHNVSDSHKYHKSLTSGGSLSSAEAVSDNSTIIVESYGMTYHDVSGAETVYVSWLRTTGSDVYTSKITNDGTPAVEAVSSDSSLSIASASSRASLTVDVATDTVYLAWIDNASGDIYLSEDSGSGWGNHTEIRDAVTASHVGANVYAIDSGDTVVGFVFLDG